MAFEERIARLTERHEALARTVELIVGQQQRNELLQQTDEVLMAQVIESIHFGRGSRRHTSGGLLVLRAGAADSECGASCWPKTV